jgi:hypothetical protein
MDVRRARCRANGNKAVIDITGKSFGRLVVIKRCGSGPRGGALWGCRCDHGGIGRPKMIKALGIHLRAGIVKSCGCLLVDNCRALGKKARVHGLNGTRLYYTWSNMMSRCYRPLTRGYKHYGGRGIKVFTPWKTPAKFFDWALSSGYTDRLTIERIDVDEGYNPNNCCWIRIGLQGRNKQKTVRVRWSGKTRTLVECCEMEGVRYKAVLDRISRGWNLRDALTIPTSRSNSVYRNGKRIHADTP